jgi:hypothetical protein
VAVSARAIVTAGLANEVEAVNWASPCGVEGSVRNPSTPGGWNGRKADPKALYARV